MQSKWGDRSHPRLNTGGRPIANKYGDGKVKRTSKGGSKALEIAGGEPDVTDADPVAARPWPPREGDVREAKAPGRPRIATTAARSAAGPSARDRRRAERRVASARPKGRAAGAQREARLRPEAEGARHAGHRAGPGGRRSVTAPRGAGAGRRLPDGRETPGSRRLRARRSRPTRLETRTKESNACASGGARGPDAKRK